jgi:Xaa-Pro aminopeptidase
MATVLLFGDTIRYPAIRHEVPLEIVDPLLFVEHDGKPRVLTSSLEAARIAEAVPGVELLLFEELEFFELLEGGVSYEDAELEIAVRALAGWGVESAVVPADLPVAVADRLRGAGVTIAVDVRAVQARRRVKNAAELAGIRRAQRAAEAGWAAAV